MTFSFHIPIRYFLVFHSLIVVLLLDIPSETLQTLQTLLFWRRGIFSNLLDTAWILLKIHSCVSCQNGGRRTESSMTLNSSKLWESMQKKTVIEKQPGNIQSMKQWLPFTIFSSKLWLLFEGGFYSRKYGILESWKLVRMFDNKCNRKSISWGNFVPLMQDYFEGLWIEHSYSED